MTQTLNRSALELKSAVLDELRWTPAINSTHITVAVLDGEVTLSGEVDTYPEILLAGKAALRVRGVTALVETIIVRRSQDSVDDVDIIAEAGDALQRAVDVPDSVAVAVEAGVITLSGEVAWQYEREAAARAVRYLRGVNRIHNSIHIRPTPSAAGLEALIGAALVRSAQLKGKNICVTTDARGSITLTGTVTSWADSKQAEHACWAAAGITKVDNQLRLQF